MSEKKTHLASESGLSQVPPSLGGEGWLEMHRWAGGAGGGVTVMLVEYHGVVVCFP